MFVRLDLICRAIQAHLLASARTSK